MTGNVIDFCFQKRPAIVDIIAERDATISRLRGIVKNIVDLCKRRKDVDDKEFDKILETITSKEEDSRFSLDPNAVLLMHRDCQCTSPRHSPEHELPFSPLFFIEEDDDDSEMEDIIKTAVMTHKGCTTIQHMITNAGDALARMRVANSALESMSGNLVSLCCNVNSKFAIRTALEFADEPHQKSVLDKIGAAMSTIGRNENGSNVIQWIMKSLPCHVTEEFCEIIANHTIELFDDRNGMFVVIDIIQEKRASANKIFLNVIGDTFGFSNTVYGCTVVRTCIDSAPDDVRDTIFINMAKRALDFSRSKYSNYVMQSAIENIFSRQIMTSADVCLWRSVVDESMSMCTSQYGSNVVETALKSSVSRPEYFEIFGRLCMDAKFLRLVDDKYGNYVIQRMISTCDANSFGDLYSVLIRYVGTRKTKFSNHVKQKLFERKI